GHLGLSSLSSLSSSLLSLSLGLLRLSGGGLLSLELLGGLNLSLDRVLGGRLLALELDGVLGTLLALEGLPVTRELEQRGHLLGGLGANAQPVLRTLGVDLDDRGLLGGVVLADLLDGTAVALRARVHDDNAVERGALLAEALQTNLHSHG